MTEQQEQTANAGQGHAPAESMAFDTPLAFQTAIASICHEANRAYCKSIGDTSQPSWEEAPDWQKESAIAGVSFHMANPTASPSASHEAWRQHKEAEGWDYGIKKDPFLKQHPCMVPYDELPIEQRRKDYLFRAIVHAFMTNPDVLKEK